MANRRRTDPTGVGKKRSYSRGMRVVAEIPPELENRLRKYKYENSVSTKWVLCSALEAFLPK